MSTRQAIPEPVQISRLRRDRHGRAVPWFIDWNDGNPDFRVVRRGVAIEALRKGLCWVCGTHRGADAAFVLTGPISVVNRFAPEPPCHAACAIYTVRACPFLTTPRMRRRENNLPDDRIGPSDAAILDNPGVAVVWFGGPWSIERDGSGGVLFKLGAPSQVRWYSQGVIATRDQVLEAFDASLPRVRAWAQEDGPEHVLALEGRVAAAMVHVPAAAG